MAMSFAETAESASKQPRHLVNPFSRKRPPRRASPPTKETKPKSGITRCPACGEIVDKNAVICPSCGFGIRDVADGSIALLSQKLDLIESKRPQKRKKDENDTISATDERKISLIRSWPIPTNKDDLIEFAAMASGNCVAPPNDYMYRTAEDALADAWRSKFDQAYAKAEHLFGNSEDFVLLEKLKTDIQRRAFISRLRSWGPLIALVIIFNRLPRIFLHHVRLFRGVNHG